MRSSPPREGQLGQHVEVAQGSGRSSVTRSVASSRISEACARSRERQAAEPAPIRHGLADQAVQQSRPAIGFGRCLHLQPNGCMVFAVASISATSHGRRTHDHSTQTQTSIESPQPTASPRPRTMHASRRTAAALEANGITVLRAADAADAKDARAGPHPRWRPGASRRVAVARGHRVSPTSSRTSGRYDPVRPQIWSMDRETQADEIRRLSAAPDVMLGSVHAVTETGRAGRPPPMSGSQLGPYVSGAGPVILVVGTQKIVSDLEEAPPSDR